MSDPWSVRVQTWRNESPAKSANQTAEKLLDVIDAQKLKDELSYYLQTLYNQTGPNTLQPKPIEGPEDFHILLNNAEVLKRYKARIRAIGLEAHNYVHTADELIDTIKKTLQLRPEFAELRTVDQRETILRLVARELFELKSLLEEVLHVAKEVGSEYSSAFDFTALEYNIVNAMSYHRGLYGPADAKNTAPRRF